MLRANGSSAISQASGDLCSSAPPPRWFPASFWRPGRLLSGN